MPNAEHVAVIVVPGIFASHLVDPSGQLAWPVNATAPMLRHIVSSPSQQRAAFAAANSVRFIARGPDSILPAGVPETIDSKSGWQNLFLGSYGAFMDACARAGESGNKDLPFQPHVFGLGYNFTRSNSVTSWRNIAPETLRILQVLRTKLQADKLPNFIFVTHSMGALAVRYTLKTNPQLRKNCISVVHVAAPNAGAPETLMRFIRGTEDDPPVGLIFGKQGWKCLTSASAIRAGFQLLPFPMLRHTDRFGEVVTPRDETFHLGEIIKTQFPPPTGEETAIPTVTFRVNGVDKSVAPDRDDFFRYRTAYNQRDAIANDVNQHLEAARDFHKELGDYMFERTGAVVLDDVDTVQSVKLTFTSDGFLESAVETRTNEGDGTVPRSSQLHLIPDTFAAQGGAHFDLVVNMTRVAHADALSIKATNRDADAFKKIFTLMRRLHQASKLPGVTAAVEPGESKSTTVLAAFHGAGQS